jgi:pimeloyl-ACP methyl ester carboxylesterase
MTDAIEPFRIAVDDRVLHDLRDRLALTRFPDELEGADWDYGFQLRYLRELVEYWRDAYDWRAEEAKLNALPQFRTRIDGCDIHFVHVRSEAADAFPILLMHGWPGSFIEFVDVVPKLRDRFHLVIPSLPGYGFSEPPHTTGWHPVRIARAFAELMARLGYDRYGAQGGDWGSQVATRIATIDADHCAAIHLNMAIAGKPDDAPALSDADQADLAAMAQFQREESGYALEQGTKPHTLGVSLDDSPAGLLAWIVEKFRTWSDCDGHPENAFTREQLLTNVTIYWATRTITSSVRLYREARLAERADRTPARIEVPTGIARYPKEIIRFPRPWVEARYNVTHWADLPRGGHFAAMEQPELFAADVAAFFAGVR